MKFSNIFILHMYGWGGGKFACFHFSLPSCKINKYLAPPTAAVLYIEKPRQLPVQDKRLCCLFCVSWEIVNKTFKIEQAEKHESRKEYGFIS